MQGDYIVQVKCSDPANQMVSGAAQVVKVGNTTPGKTGLWLFRIGEQQEFDRLAVSTTPFEPPPGSIEAGSSGVIRTERYHAPDLPSPQEDWVLVLERLKP